MRLVKLHLRLTKIGICKFFLNENLLKLIKTRITGNTGINKGKQNEIYFYGIYFSDRLNHEE